MTDRATFVSFSGARRHRRGPLAVSVVPAPGGSPSDPPRVAFQIGRHVGGAVVRNRLRRRLRGLLQARAGELLPGAAYLIAVRPEAAGWTTDRLADDLDAVLAATKNAPDLPARRI